MPEITQLELVARLALALLLCGAIGLEREVRGQVAGLRTHVLVGMGSALFTLISAYAFTGFIQTNPAGGFVTTVDPTRIAAQVVAGIGFLGAGAIIRQGFTVRGLTTAAALWIVAAIGMAAGAGYYTGAIATTVLVLVALIVLRRARPLLGSAFSTELYYLDLELSKTNILHLALAALARHQVSVESISSEREGEEQDVRLELRVAEREELERAMEEIQAIEGVLSTNLQSPRGLI